jgi:hypothetical protein
MHEHVHKHIHIYMNMYMHIHSYTRRQKHIRADRYIYMLSDTVNIQMYINTYICPHKIKQMNICTYVDFNMDRNVYMVIHV